jgi:hypothetical protein
MDLILNPSDRWPLILVIDLMPWPQRPVRFYEREVAGVSERAELRSLRVGAAAVHNPMSPPCVKAIWVLLTVGLRSRRGLASRARHAPLHTKKTRARSNLFS